LGAFFNTGALSSNYISVELAAWLIQNGVKLCRCSRTICSSVARCAKSTGMLDFDFDFTLINEITLINTSIILTARILNSEYDLIIGLPTLRQYNLLQALLINLMLNLTSIQDFTLHGLTIPLSVDGPRIVGSIFFLIRKKSSDQRVHRNFLS